jgi:hypothetical protein
VQQPEQAQQGARVQELPLRPHYHHQYPTLSNQVERATRKQNKNKDESKTVHQRHEMHRFVRRCLTMSVQSSIGLF